jgi:hypothetical protein
MKKNVYPKWARSRNSLNQLDLFDWLREEDFRAANPEACRWARRHGTSVRHAALLMDLNGFGAR